MIIIVKQEKVRKNINYLLSSVSLILHVYIISLSLSPFSLNEKEHSFPHNFCIKWRDKKNLQRFPGMIEVEKTLYYLI